ncbi:LOW QUALITY PROTEIN: X-box-binding protein 1 [Megalops cyprinoides]|uniref:LOW QUALITY PROTEIN: X-box-binding protein 1 n=1 Tax=Megalops cyprinoides TaxID=118141 RepID=UPI0018655C77|nr:LOW QUALITY PROTEIN: X-box-binding protein 1 [Megalops cyprinoides]
MVVVTTGTGGTHKVLLISGKQTASSAGTQGGFSRSISVMLPSSGNQASSDSDSNGSGPPQRKRQRLTHLSPEEKALRRKLKNRVAAQTARDRKKAKMGELEQQVLELELENQKLHIENRLLREKTDGLLTENEELRQRLGLDTLETKEMVQVLESNVDDVSLVIGSSESAALRLRVSAAGAGPAIAKTEFQLDTGSPDSTDSESDLLLGILDILDPELFLKCSDPESQNLPELVEAGEDSVPTSPSPPLGAPPVKLEALNELIHFDHIYTKPIEVTCVEQSEDCIPDVKIEEEEVVVVETVSVKDEPEEVEVVTEMRVDDFLSPASPPLGMPEKAASYLMDAYSDSGYERSPSPFSNMSSPLCPESTWDDVFANELFPQLISV